MPPAILLVWSSASQVSSDCTPLTPTLLMLGGAAPVYFSHACVSTGARAGSGVALASMEGLAALPETRLTPLSSSMAVTVVVCATGMTTV
ncbi:hypothetical protein D3C72_1732760 [compost metagenome]